MNFYPTGCRNFIFNEDDEIALKLLLDGFQAFVVKNTNPR